MGEKKMKRRKRGDANGAKKQSVIFDGLEHVRIDAVSMDMMIFESVAVSSVPLLNMGCVQFLFLQQDNETFLSILFFNVNSIFVAEYKNPDNPFALAKRNPNGQLQY